MTNFITSPALAVLLPQRISCSGGAAASVGRGALEAASLQRLCCGFDFVHGNNKIQIPHTNLLALVAGFFVRGRIRVMTAEQCRGTQGMTCRNVVADFGAVR
jgi:hypothetical protein